MEVLILSFGWFLRATPVSDRDPSCLGDHVVLEADPGAPACSSLGLILNLPKWESSSPGTPLWGDPTEWRHLLPIFCHSYSI